MVKCLTLHQLKVHISKTLLSWRFLFLNSFCVTISKDMQTFSPVESSMPIKDPEPVKEAEKPDGEKGKTYQHVFFS